MLLDVFLLFFLIFSFPIPVLGNSLFVAFFIAIIRISYSVYKRKYLCDLFTSKYVVNLLSFAFILALISFLYVSLRGTFDYEKSYSYISQIIGFVISTFVIASLEKRDYKLNYLTKCIIIVFLLQTFIEVVALVTPAFRIIVLNFQFKDQAKVAEFYGGIRGNAISGRLFFVLAALWSVVHILFMKYVLDNKKYSLKYIVGFIIIFIGGLFVGRTSIIGFGFAILYLIFYRTDLKYKIKFIFRFILIGFVSCFFVYLLLPSSIKDLINNKIIPWAFDFIISYITTGKVSSYSLHSLNDMYNIEITLEEWFIGVAKYVDKSGGYYKHTDSGYLRQILFYGLVGSALNLIYMISFIYRPFLLICRKVDSYNSKLFFILLVSLILLLQYKGDIMGQSRFFMVVIYMYMLIYIQDETRED